MNRTLLLTPSTRPPAPVSVQGSKNVFLHMAALPLIGDHSFECSIERVPDITDTHVVREMLTEMTFAATFVDNRFVVSGFDALTGRLPTRWASRVRPTMCFAIAIASARGSCLTPRPGGDSFTVRPFDVHLRIVEVAGGRVSPRDGGHLLIEFPKGCRPFDVSVAVAPYGPSLGATVTALLVASRCDGTSLIRAASAEPEIDAVIEGLRAAGVCIERDQGRLIVKSDGSPLHGQRVPHEYR